MSTFYALTQAHGTKCKRWIDAGGVPLIFFYKCLEFNRSDSLMLKPYNIRTQQWPLLAQGLIIYNTDELNSVSGEQSTALLVTLFKDKKG